MDNQESMFREYAFERHTDAEDLAASLNARDRVERWRAIKKTEKEGLVGEEWTINMPAIDRALRTRGLKFVYHMLDREFVIVDANSDARSISTTNNIFPYRECRW